MKVVLIGEIATINRVYQVVQGVKNLPSNAGDASDAGLIPALGRSLGEGNGKLYQHFLPGEFHEQRSPVGYSHGVTKELEMTERTHTHTHTHTAINTLKIRKMSSQQHIFKI